MTTDQLTIDTALAAWRQAVAQASETFNSLTDDQIPARGRARQKIASFTSWAI